MIHEAEKKDGKRTHSIDIYYSSVGIVNIPTDEEIEESYAKRRSRQST